MMSVATVEAMALLRGLKFLEKLGVSSVDIESDSLELIQTCNGDTEVSSPYTVVLADCFQIASTMDLVIFEHYFRDANTVAHNLAKHTYKSKVSLVWDDSPLFHYR
jgi:ribonuclease HI